MALRQLFLTTLWIHHRHMVQLLQHYGLTHPQFLTLISLAVHGRPASMRELCEVSFQDGPTMTGIVDRLVKMKFVKRTRDEHDRRVVLVETTADGMQLADRIKLEIDREESLQFEAMGEDDLTKLEELFDHVMAGALNKMRKLGGADVEALKNRLREFTVDPIEFVKTLEEEMKEKRE
jgi:DNA-binding MarR family transcriptional regulator